MEATLPGRAYRSEAFFELERERIFFRDWVCVGREETIADTGSYLLVDLLGESLLVVRTREGGIGGFHNVCRHRGSRLVIDDPATCDAAGLPCAGGRFKGSIVCPYHSWTYGLAGELRNAPFLNESNGLRKEQLPLFSVDVETWGGFVFVNLSRDGSGETPERNLPVQLGEIPSTSRTIRCRSSARAGGSPTRSRRTGSASSRTTTSATTAGRCTRSSADSFPPSRRPAAASSTGRTGFRTVRARRRSRSAGRRQRAPFPGSRRRGAGPSQGRARLSEPDGERLAPTTWPPSRSGRRRPATRASTATSSSIRTRSRSGLRSLRRCRVLGPREPSRLADLRERPGRHGLAGVLHRLLRPDGGLEHGHPPVPLRQARSFRDRLSQAPSAASRPPLRTTDNTSGCRRPFVVSMLPPSRSGVPSRVLTRPPASSTIGTSAA